ncbi:hypothetical protein AK830_g688 [Neonectria ditissima]|uniref:Heterokaryon incompatibility domain-containing protein n=1 Tax=Neonectria ditissima TaxID=78410 RepID=A0A0P7BXV6_9HYPO|nr:hypothetical protein AK830_g688 [Neonectria ditissima]
MLPLLGPPKAPAYRYSPITSHPRAFRLVRLLPPIRAILGSTLHIELITVDDESSCTYETLSYTWGVTGKDAPNRRVIVETQHGPRELHIYRPLELALLSIKANRPLFIDQICINQKDDDEKACQVQLMRDIYSKCSRVLVWLGPETKASKSYFTYIHQVCSEAVLGRVLGPNKATFPELWTAIMDYTVEVAGSVREDRDDVWALLSKYGDKFPLNGAEDVMRRAWFNRLWIIQEVCLAPNVLFICGSQEMCFECFRTGLLFYTIYNTHWIRVVKRSVPQAEIEQRFNILTLNNSFSRMLHERRRIHEHGQRQSLYDLAIKYNVNEGPKIGSSLPEDRVFGVMGLADPTTLVGMKVRYGDAAGVFTEIAALLAIQNLDIILFSQFPKSIANLPSWAPDWSMDLRVPRGYMKLTEPAFAAGGPAQSVPEINCDSGRLFVRGVSVGRVVRVGQKVMLSETEKKVEDQVDYLSVQEFFDEIDEFVSQSRLTEDLEMASIRLADFSNSVKRFASEYPDVGTESLKKLKEQASKWSQRLINTEKTVQSYHIRRIVGTVGTLPWYWVPASEIDTLQLWAVDPVAACVKWTKAAGLFLFDLVGLSLASSAVMLTAQYIKLRRKLSPFRFNESNQDPIKAVGLDLELYGEKMSTYSTCLHWNTARRLYLTENGYVGTGPDDTQEGDRVVVLFGATVPLLLREHTTASEGDAWSYVGEAYCEGIMDGEALGGEGTTFQIA